MKALTLHRTHLAGAGITEMNRQFRFGPNDSGSMYQGVRQ